MSGGTAKVGSGTTGSASRASSCTANQKKRLSEASRMLKSSMGFAIAGCADCQNVREQALMTAAVQNMKKMAIHLDRREKRG